MSSLGSLEAKKKKRKSTQIRFLVNFGGPKQNEKKKIIFNFNFGDCSFILLEGFCKFSETIFLFMYIRSLRFFENENFDACVPRTAKFADLLELDSYKYT